MGQRRKQIFAFVFWILWVASPSSPESPVTRYRNPLGVSIADPFVMKDGDSYYLYGTTDASQGLEVFFSADLVQWRRRGWCYRKTPNTWGQDCFWAPEVLKSGSTYFLFYTAYNPGANVRNICVATSPSPLGPFTDVQTPLLPVTRGFIDPSPFQDPVSGANYLYVMEENLRPPKILVARLSDTLTSVTSSLTECLTADQKWESNWVEGPFVFRHGNWYYMTYSGQGYASPDYSVGYATADRPLGPWTKYSGNPVLHKSQEVSGPGHNSLVASPDGAVLFLVYHRHLTFAGGWQRELAIDRVAFSDNDAQPDLFRIPGGPSSTLQPLPAGAAPRKRGASDPFDSPSMDFTRWSIFGEDRDFWRLDSHALVIDTQDGDLWTNRVDARNVFLQFAPEGDFDIETGLTFAPQADFEQAFLILWEDQSNYVKLATVHTSGAMFEVGVERAGQYRNTIVPNPLGADVRLRIERRGNRCVCSASAPGNAPWSPVGTAIDFPMTQPQVGVGACSPGSGARRPVRFEYFALAPTSAIDDRPDR